MSRREKPLHLEVSVFVKHHLAKDCFAPFTGQDWPAWIAFVYLVQTWTRGGGPTAIAAMEATVRCAQRRSSILRTFVQAIPAVGDWCHVKEIWPQVCGREPLLDDSTPAQLLLAIERGEDRYWTHGLAAPSVAIITGGAR